jgi:hypothetical protein
MDKYGKRVTMVERVGVRAVRERVIVPHEKLLAVLFLK